MFLTYTFCRRGGAGGNFSHGHQDIKTCIPFLLSGGAGGNFAQVWENWQIETVNLKTMKFTLIGKLGEISPRISDWCF